MGSRREEDSTAATSATPAASTPAASPAGGQDREKGAAGSATASGSRGLSERDSFRISCLRNAHYHEDRERFFARLHRIAMFVVVASGTASFAFVRGVPVFAGLVTLAGLLDLVFDVSGKARLHASLRRRIYDVLAQAEDETRPVSQLKEQAVRIYADEPPTMHAVNALAYNAAMLSFGRPSVYLMKVSPQYRILRHWISFASTQFKTYAEIRDAEALASKKSNASHAT